MKTLKEADKDQLILKFRNGYAVAKWDHSFKTYTQLCELDEAKGLQVNTTYENDKSARNFIHFITKAKGSELQVLVEKSKYISLCIT